MPAIMTPAQTIADLLSTIPDNAETIPAMLMDALRTASRNACDEEECVHRLLAGCRRVVMREVVRCQVQADADAAAMGKPHPRSEEALAVSREMLHSIDARLGIGGDL